MHWLIATLLIVLIQDGPARAPVPREGAAPRRLVVTYSDGRTSPHLLRPRGGSWTPKFPRQANPPPYEGLPLNALQVDFEVDRDIVITVSLKYGSPHQKTVQVATVRLGTDPVRVSDLERYGVDPIVLSLDDYSPAPLVQPTVTSASPLLDVTVDLMRHDVPIYKVTFRNRAARAVMAVSFKMFRGEKEVGSGRRKTNRSTPIVDAAGEYTFDASGRQRRDPGIRSLRREGRLVGQRQRRRRSRAEDQRTGADVRVCAAAPPSCWRCCGDAAPANDSTAGTEEPRTGACAIEALPIAVDEPLIAAWDRSASSQYVLSVKNGKGTGKERRSAGSGRLCRGARGRRAGIGASMESTRRGHDTSG